MKEEEHVELIIEGAWFRRFPWSQLLIDPDSGLGVNSPAVALHGRILNLGHPYGVVVATDATWDAKGSKHPGLEALIPWSDVIGILKIEGDADSARSFGFTSKGSASKGK